MKNSSNNRYSPILRIFFWLLILLGAIGVLFYLVSRLSDKAPVTSLTPQIQTPANDWILGDLIYEEDFEDELINKLRTISGRFDIVQTSDGNHVWRTLTNGNLSQVTLPTTSNDYAVEAKIMQVSGKEGLGFIEIRMEEGSPCGRNYGVYLDAYGDWLNLVERGTNCEELREDGLFANYKTTMSNGIWYTVRIEAKGAEVRVYLDGKLVAQDKDIDGTISKSNKVGFSTCCGDIVLPYTFDFDDIKVWLIAP